MLRFFVKITCFLSFSGKTHAESFINFVKNLILNPKHAKFDQKSEIGHVRAVGGRSAAVGFSGRDTLENAAKIISKTKFSIHFVQIPYHLHLARQGAHLEVHGVLEL